MASFFSNILSIFTGGTSQAGTEKSAVSTVSAEPQVHAGCTIYATPQRGAISSGSWAGSRRM